jgi:asparagine synthetase B (glutamine-hydrolysing)
MECAEHCVEVAVGSGNGHSFATRSDTSKFLVLIGQSSEDCVHHFNVKWAFPTYDRDKSTSFLSMIQR